MLELLISLGIVTHSSPSLGTGGRDGRWGRRNGKAVLALLSRLRRQTKSSSILVWFVKDTSLLIFWGKQTSFLFDQKECYPRTNEQSVNFNKLTAMQWKGKFVLDAVVSCWTSEGGRYSPHGTCKLLFSSCLSLAAWFSVELQCQTALLLTCMVEKSKYMVFNLFIMN